MKTIKYILIIALLSINIPNAHAQNYKHFIIYGQSLSVGHQSYPPISLESLSGNYMIGNQLPLNYGNSGEEVLSPLVSRIEATTLNGTAAYQNRSSASRAENPLIGAVNHIRLKIDDNDNYLATSCGVGGTTIEQLSKGSKDSYLYQCFENALETASYIIEKEKSDITCPAIFWMQGEQNYTATAPGYTADSKCTADKDKYKEWLLLMKNNMQQDIMSAYSQSEKPVFITYQAGCQYVKNQEITVGMAQLEVSNEEEDIICAGPVYPMTDRGGHLDSNGYRWFGEMLGKVYYRTQILKEDFKPLQPKRLVRTDNPKQIRIEFHIPAPPLVLDNNITTPKNNYGFEIYVGKTKKTIKSVELEDDCIIITATTNLTGDVSVIYAGQINGGHGNLRDSDDYQSFYNYIDLDGKDEQGKYIFERDAAETTLRPSHEPTDENGNVIYGKPYPLYNFCVSFYYQLKADETEMIISNVGGTSSMKELSEKDAISLSITNDSFIIESELIGDLHIEIMDLSGNILQIIEGNKTGRIQNYKLTNNNSGILLIKVRIGDVMKVFKSFV